MKDWNTFHRRINIDAYIQDIYSAWATKAGIESWFLSRADYQMGDGTIDHMMDRATYKWEWFGHPNYFEDGKIVSANGEDQLEFTFNGCLVVVKIYEEMGENIVHLTQGGIPECNIQKDNLVVACGQGWTFYLANLKSVLEGGLDLRNKNDHLKDMMNS